MYAVLKIGGKQYKVEEGQEVLVEKVFEKKSETLSPLMIVDGENVDLSQKGKVKISILEEAKGPKVIAFKYKPKKGYKRKVGHRQQYLKIKIDKISLAGEKPKTGSNKEEIKTEKETVKKVASAKKVTAPKTKAEAATKKKEAVK